MIRFGSNADHSLELGTLLDEIRNRKELRRNRLSTSYRHRSTGNNNPSIIREDGFGDNVAQHNDTGSNLAEDGESLNKETVPDFYLIIQHDFPMMGDVSSINEPSELERETLERSNSLLKVSDDDGKSACGDPPSTEVSSISSPPSDGQVSPSSIPRLTLSSQSCDEIERDECPLDQDVEDLTPDIDDKIPDGTKVDPTFLLRDDEEDFAQATVCTKGVKGCVRNKLKRPNQKLMVDEVKNLSIKEMESQMSDTTDIVTKIDLAPPTKRFVHWNETGRAKTLFGLPGRPILAQSLVRHYQRNLTSLRSESDEFGPTQKLNDENKPLECETAAEKETIPALETATSSSDNCLVTDTNQENASLQQNHQTNQNLSEGDKWYYYGPNKSKRLRYLLCGDCDYKTYHRPLLVAHAKSQHASSTTAFLSSQRAPRKVGRKTLLPKARRRAQLIEMECAFDHCNYKTMKQYKLKQHETFHRRKSYQQCLICSYSTKTITLLKIHVQRDHPQERDYEEEPSVNQVDLTTSEPPMLEEMRENDNLQSLDDKESIASSSSPPDLNDGAVSVSQENTPAHQRTVRHRTKADDGDWYYNSNRKWRYKFCDYCDYKAVRRTVVEAHIRKRHFSPKTVLPAPPKKIAPKSILHRCPHQCEYQAANRIDLERHVSHHVKKSAYQCQFCNYSVKMARFLRLHVIRDHPGTKIDEMLPSGIKTSAAATKTKFNSFGRNKRKKFEYKNCGDCDFKTIHRSRLVTHIKMLHPKSTTALPPLLRKARPDSYSCSYCSLQFKSLFGFEHHERLHLKKSYHQCTFCSFSVSTLKHLKSHVKRAHLQLHKDTSDANHISVDLVPQDSDQTATLETNLTPLPTDEPSVSALLFHCSFCRFQTNTEDIFRRHVKFHTKKSTHQCPCCSFSRRDRKSLEFHFKRDHTETERAKISKNQDNDPTPAAFIPASKESMSASSFFKEHPASTLNHDNADRSAETRQKNYFCTDSRYITSEQIAHALEALPSPTTAAPPKNQHECCLDCSCLCNLFQNFHVLENLPHERYTNLFHRRSISPARGESDSLTEVSSEEDNESEGSGYSTEDEKVRERTEQYLVKQFGLRESYVKLHNIIVSAKLQLERTNEPTTSTGSKTAARLRMKRKYESKGKVEQKSVSKTKNEIKTLISRVEFMGKKAQIAADDLKKSKLNKECLVNKINDIISKKTEAEIELRMKQCKALELKMSFLDRPEIMQSKDRLASIEELIKKLESVVERMGVELQKLRKEEADLSENVEDAERSHFGIMEVLAGLQSEFKNQQSNMNEILRIDSKSAETILKKIRK